MTESLNTTRFPSKYVNGAQVRTNYTISTRIQLYPPSSGNFLIILLFVTTEINEVEHTVQIGVAN